MTIKLVKDKRAGSRAGVTVICPAKNEMAILPHFLEHYRKIGAEQFIFIDNNSDDGSLEYLSEQPDCQVFFTDQDYRVSQFARNWINEVISTHFESGWLLYADADEHLVFPDCENKSVSHYCEALARDGKDAAYAMMLDMYPDGDFISTPPITGKALTETMPNFDRDYVIRSWPKRFWQADPTQFKPQVLGGPRCRIISSLEAEIDRGALSYLALNQVDRFVDLVPLSAMRTLAKIWPLDVPAQQKMPLNFVRPGFKYFNSHTSSNSSIGDDLLVFLHFKFCSELQARFKMARVEANHYRRGLHYLQLQQAVRRWKGSLVYDGTETYRSSEDLVRAGLLGPAAGVVWRAQVPTTYRSGKRGPLAPAHSETQESRGD